MKDAVKLHPWTRQGYISEQVGHFRFSDINVLDLVKEFGSPLYVYSEKKLKENARSAKQSLESIHTNIRIFYASKACSNLTVLKTLKDEGLGIEVNSGGELFKALEAGFHGSQIVFNGVAKLDSEIAAAISNNIEAINVDSVFEMERIARIVRMQETPVNVALRIIPEISGGGMAGWSTGSSLSKFGMTTEEFGQALAIAKSMPDLIRVKGVHCHIGSQVNNLGLYAREAQFIVDFVSQLKHEHSIEIEHINLGGGFPKSYVPASDNLSGLGKHYSDTYYSNITYDDVTRVLIAPIKEVLGEGIQLFIEPGRSMVSDTAILLTQVQGVKYRNHTPWLYMDAGYSVLFDIFISWYFHTVNASKAADGDTELYRIAGPLCDSHDTFFDVEGETLLQELLHEAPELSAYKQLLASKLIHQPSYRELPKDTSAGDVLALFDVGAYSLENMNHYCGRFRPAVVMAKEDGTAQLIRRKDTPDDLINHEVM